MSVYLDIATFKLLTVLPPSYVDELETEQAGWMDAQIDVVSRWVDARLRKRYVTPFARFDATPPTPRQVQSWVARILTPLVWIRRGVDPGDLQFDVVRQDADDAREEVKEAATAEDGLFDIPTETDADATAIARTETRGYSEQSPYVGFDRQRETGHHEDTHGSGTHV